MRISLSAPAHREFAAGIKKLIEDFNRLARQKPKGNRYARVGLFGSARVGDHICRDVATRPLRSEVRDMAEFHEIVPGAEFYSEFAEAMRGTEVDEDGVWCVGVEMLRANGQVIIMTMDPSQARDVARQIMDQADSVERHRQGQ